MPANGSPQQNKQHEEGASLECGGAGGRAERAPARGGVAPGTLPRSVPWAGCLAVQGSGSQVTASPSFSGQVRRARGCKAGGWMQPILQIASMHGPPWGLQQEMLL